MAMTPTPSVRLSLKVTIMTEVIEVQEKSRRTISPEHKTRMAAGRRRAAAARKVKPKEVVEQVKASDEFAGLTAETCPSACTADCCVITGRRKVQFENNSRSPTGEFITTYESGTVTHCGHPAKSGLQAIHKMMPDVLVKYNRAKMLLEHLAVEKKNR